MNVADSVAKAVIDNIDHSYIPAMIDLVKRENVSDSLMCFSRMLDQAILEAVNVSVHRQHVLFEAYIKNDQHRLGHHALRHDENALEQLTKCLYALEEKYNIPCSLEVNHYPSCRIWRIAGKKGATPSADCEA